MKRNKSLDKLYQRIQHDIVNVVMILDQIKKNREYSGSPISGEEFQCIAELRYTLRHLYTDIENYRYDTKGED